jgi:hypothetical protein
MVTIAIGLGLTTGPATESIMGSLPEEKAGVGSAVNDTTRELGGTLGVAVVGSVFASIYGAALVDALQPLDLPSDLLDAAGESTAAALSIAQSLPGDVGAGVVTAAQDAFIDGLSSGSLVAAGVAAVGAVVALAFLPARQSLIRQVPVSTALGDENAASTAGRSSSAVKA